MGIKSAIKSLPLVGSVVRKLRGGSMTPPPVPFSTSGDYWEGRYQAGGNSGAGSYNRLARFKADVLNEFVATHGIRTIAEFGSGDGAQLELAKYPAFIGVDVARTVVEECRRRFKDKPNYRFLHTSEVTSDLKVDLSLSLDVIYHLVEDETFDTYMRQLFDAGDRFVIVYASNEDKAWPSPHVRHRKFTDWVDKNRPDFAIESRIPNKYPYDDRDPDNTSFADFYVYRRVK